MSDLRDFTGKNRKFTGTGGITIPSGTSAERPSGAVGQTRYNTDTGSIEFYDGVTWIATNLIPTIDSISGDVYNGQASNITLTLTNATDIIDVVYSEGGIELAQDTGVSVSGGSATSAVPSAVYNQSVGDTITVSIKNQDGTPSSNSVNLTILGLPTGGSISSSGGYRIHTFNSSATFNVPAGFSKTAEYLIVAGGGGGGADNSGGGGAGGMLTGSTSISTNSYSIVVGGGGAGSGPSGGDSGPYATNGVNSTALGLTAIGGGGGGSAGGQNGQAGGSGGGGAGEAANSQGGAGTAGQGNAGGNNVNSGGGGGGGAGGAGQNGNIRFTDSGGNGGAGLASSISGSSQFYAAGGGGGNQNGIYNPQSRASGIGGITNANANTRATSGIANTGSGGGAATHTVNVNPAGADGASGIVIIRYQV
jgi:hypothetical protein